VFSIVILEHGVYWIWMLVPGGWQIKIGYFQVVQGCYASLLEQTEAVLYMTPLTASSCGSEYLDPLV
jgi:hypothetical protein